MAVIGTTSYTVINYSYVLDIGFYFHKRIEELILSRCSFSQQETRKNGRHSTADLHSLLFFQRFVSSTKSIHRSKRVTTKIKGRAALSQSQLPSNVLRENNYHSSAFQSPVFGKKKHCSVSIHFWLGSNGVISSTVQNCSLIE